MKPFIFLSFFVLGSAHLNAQELDVPKIENQPEERLGLPQTNRNELHGDLNESDKAMKVLVIEFKTPVPEIEKKKVDGPEEPKHKYGTHD
jgi:hypothetical protein